MSTSPSHRVTNASELGSALAAIRRDKGISQAEAAALIGAHRPYLSKIESGVSTEVLTRVFLLLRECGYEVVLQPKATHDG